MSAVITGKKLLWCYNKYRTKQCTHTSWWLVLGWVTDAVRCSWTTFYSMSDEVEEYLFDPVQCSSVHFDAVDNVTVIWWLHSAIESELALSARPSSLGSSLNVATTPPINERRRADDWAVFTFRTAMVGIVSSVVPSTLQNYRNNKLIYL